MLSEKRAKSKTTVEKNLYKLLANSTYGEFVETGLKRMKVKFANTWNEREAIIPFDNVELLGQDTDSLIVQLSDKGNIVHKMCDMYKSFDFSELDNTSYFYGELVKYYEHEVDKSKFPSLESFINFNKKLPGPIFKDKHNGHRITEFVGLRPKMYCLVDEKQVMHNVA